MYLWINETGVWELTWTITWVLSELFIEVGEPDEKLPKFDLVSWSKRVHFGFQRNSFQTLPWMSSNASAETAEHSRQGRSDKVQ